MAIVGEQPTGGWVVYVTGATMNVQEWIDYGFSEAGVPELSKVVYWEWNNRFTTRLGDAKYNRVVGRGKIRLSSKLWPSMSEVEQIDTVLHEVAHIVDMYNNTHTRRNDGHNESWKRICRQIGANPKRYASADVADFAQFRRRVARYRVSCGCANGHVVTKTLLTKMKRSYRRYTCRKCGCQLGTDGVLV